MSYLDLPVQHMLGGAAAMEFREFYCNLFDTVAGQHALNVAVAESLEAAACAERYTDDANEAQFAYSEQMLDVLFWKRYQAELLPFRVFLSERETGDESPVGDRVGKRILRLMLDDDAHEDFRARWIAQGHRLPDAGDWAEAQ